MEIEKVPSIMTDQVCVHSLDNFVFLNYEICNDILDEID